VTRKAFWSDPYCTTLDARVVRCDGPEIQLDTTIFFAFSGGQESDFGTIGGVTVQSARKMDRDIVYTLPNDHGLKVGQNVTVEIDWERRYRLMRLHFAAELVLEIFYRRLEGVGKVGAHVSQEKARIDFAWPESIASVLAAVSDEANAIIASDVAIRTGFDDAVNERRYWEIEGFTRVPCGGTHVRRTGEIGPIRLKRNNIGKGKERVEIFLEE